MESAYLYVRVSTDEQKRKGYSLPEQEDRLIKYCEFNNIKVKGIYQEDFSAKSFNRPEWKKLIAIIKMSSVREANNILFVKWDRFSRNIEYAYEMIGILRKYNATAMAIDQPIDLSVPESSVMLAVYLSVPEAENSRRALNTANGIRRAKQMGRYPNKAPLGYINLSTPDGKKYITPQQPEAGFIKWVFQQLARNCYTIEEVRRMAAAKGLKCSRSNFWKLIHNPAYCGLVKLSSSMDSPQYIRALHQPLIPDTLFYEIQNIISTKRKVTGKREELKAAFPLRGYLTCPVCARKLCGSFSRGSTKRYPYYHCAGNCKTRFKADVINNFYHEKLQQFVLSNAGSELVNLVLEDVNVGTQRIKYLHERKLLLKQLEEQESIISKARKLFVADQIKFDDFSGLKKEYQNICDSLKTELSTVTIKLDRINQQFKLVDRSFVNIFNGFQNWDVGDKKQIINLIPPINIDIQTGEVSVRLNNSLSKILFFKTKATQMAV